MINMQVQDTASGQSVYFYKIEMKLLLALIKIINSKFRAKI